MPVLLIFLLQDSDLVIDGAQGSYAIIMYTLFGVHILAFATKLRIYKIVMPKAKTEDDDDFQQADKKISTLDKKDVRRASILPSDSIKTISFEDHYKEMKRVFDTSCFWVWIVHTLAIVGCLIAFIMIDGKELFYALYIPLDVLLCVGKGSFFWINYW